MILKHGDSLWLAESIKPDGNFSTVASPNPENPEGFALAEELANEVGADILIGTDPDRDRIGVMMGLPFPAGPHLEAVAKENRSPLPKKHPKIQGTYASLSGLENLSEKLYRETADPALTAAFTLAYLGDAIEGVTENALRTSGAAPVLFVGGVMSNSILKERLAGAFDAAFAHPTLSADNAVGIAALAAYRYGVSPFRKES